MRTPLLHEQFEDLEKQAHASRLGMWIFLSSELLLFAGLFALYTGYRVMYPTDFALAVAHDNVAIGSANTAILITSSFTVALSLPAARAGRGRVAAALLAFSIACGLAFLVLKGVEYGQHFHQGIYPGTAYDDPAMRSYGAHMFFTLYYLMTGLHAIHVMVGMGLLAWIAAGAWRGVYAAGNTVRVELVALYWHLIDVVWIFLWPMLYLMHD
jgi:cytochrome c oxidase subunit III